MDVPVKKKAEGSDVEPASDQPSYIPNVDIVETEGGVTVLVDLPGVSKEAVSLSIDKGILTLSGKVKPDLPEGAEALVREFEEGDFFRSFRLGQEVDGERVEASMQDGVLKLVVPKSDWAKTKRIEVK